MSNLSLKKNILILSALAFMLPMFASAQVPRLDVTFTPDPLFSEASILPGDSVSGTIEVANNSGEAQIVITESINVSDPEGLSKNMVLTITDNNNNTYFSSVDGTFNDFLTNGELTLSNTLADGDSAIYTFEVLFLESAGNDTQTDELGFDLCVGFFDDISVMNCGDTVVSGDGNTGGGTDTEGDGGTAIEGSSRSGGGGGFPVDLVHLQISNERVVDIDDIGGAAIIAWDTNLLSTSQVVYGLSSGGPYSLNPPASNFGYPLATVEDEYKVSEHAVTITGLVPGEEYSYRVISRASPATVSYEHKFIVEKLTTEEIEEILALIDEQAVAREEAKRVNDSKSAGVSNVFSTSVVEGEQEGGVDSDSANSTSTATTTIETTTPEKVLTNEPPTITLGGLQEDELERANPSLFAAAFLSGMFGGEYSCIWFVALNLLIIYGIFLALRKYGDSTSPLDRNKILLIATLTSILVCVLVGKFCAIVPLVLLLVYFSWSIFKDGGEKGAKKDTNILHKKPLV